MWFSKKTIYTFMAFQIWLLYFVCLPIENCLFYSILQINASSECRCPCGHGHFNTSQLITQCYIFCDQWNILSKLHIGPSRPPVDVKVTSNTPDVSTSTVQRSRPVRITKQLWQPLKCPKIIFLLLIGTWKFDLRTLCQERNNSSQISWI